MLIRISALLLFFCTHYMINYYFCPRLFPSGFYLFHYCCTYTLLKSYQDRLPRHPIIFHQAKIVLARRNRPRRIRFVNAAIGLGRAPRACRKSLKNWKTRFYIAAHLFRQPLRQTRIFITKRRLKVFVENSNNTPIPQLSSSCFNLTVGCSPSTRAIVLRRFIFYEL